MRGQSVIIRGAESAPDTSPVPPSRALVPIRQLRDFSQAMRSAHAFSLPTVPLGRAECAGGSGNCGRWEVCRDTTWAMGHCVNEAARLRAIAEGDGFL